METPAQRLQNVRTLLRCLLDCIFIALLALSNEGYERIFLMEADMFAKIKRIDILRVQKYGGQYLIKDWSHLSILFCSVHRRSYLFHYRECSACHRSN